MPTANPKDKSRFILPALIFAVVTASFEVGMMYSALPTMNREFQDPVGVGWLITAYLLVASASCAISSRFGDLFGRSRMLVAMLVLALVGSVIGALAPTLVWVIIGRAVQGASDAILPLCWGLVREHFPKERVPHGVSYLAGAASIAGGLGVLLGGVMVDYFPWQSLFYVMGGFAAFSLVLALAWMPSSPPPPKQSGVDFVGGLLFVPAIALVLFAITKGKTWGWADQRTLGLIIAGLAALAFWIYYEWRHANPLIDVKGLATNRQVALANVSMALFGLGASQLMLLLLTLLQQPRWTGAGLAVSATLAGAIKIPSNLVAVVTAPWVARITVRNGARRAMIYASAILSFAWGAMTFSHDNLTFLVVMVLVVGVGGSMVFIAIPNVIVEAVSADRTSETTGLSQVVRSIFTAIGAQLATFMLASSTVTDPIKNPGVHYPSAAAYDMAFGYVTVTAVLCLLVSFALPTKAKNE